MKPGRHNGHTLFEILLALGLCLVLLVAVYGALDMHWKYAAAGREEMERLQLTRALADKLHLDIRGIVYRNPRNSAGTADGPKSSPLFGLIGEADRLRVQVGNPSRRRSRSPEQNGGIGEMDFRGHRVVSWQMAGAASDRFPVAGDASASPARERDAYGLARIDTDRLSSSNKDRGTIIAEEVTAIEFRYFDGATWHTAWDTLAKGRLPRAVEVTLKFRPLPARAVETDTQDNVYTQRVVIAVPLSEPPPAGQER